MDPEFFSRFIRHCWRSTENKEREFVRVKKKAAQSSFCVVSPGRGNSWKLTERASTIWWVIKPSFGEVWKIMMKVWEVRVAMTVGQKWWVVLTLQNYSKLFMIVRCYMSGEGSCNDCWWLFSGLWFWWIWILKS